jgi:hypothetical protein
MFEYANLIFSSIDITNIIVNEKNYFPLLYEFVMIQLLRERLKVKFFFFFSFPVIVKPDQD